MTATDKSPTARRGPGIFARQVVLYLVLILLVAGLSGQLFFSTVRANLEGEVGDKLTSLARVASWDLDLERLRLIRPGADRSRMVLRLKLDLEKVREATDLLNVYVFRPDGTSLLDLDSTVTIGSVYTLPQLSDALRASLGRGASTYTIGAAATDGAIRMSAFAPLLDESGELAYIVGVDAGARELEILERTRSSLYWIIAGCAAVGLIAALIFARSITRPVRHIAAVAERLGAGDYSARATVSTRDEVEALSDAINRMAEQVRDRDTALKEMAASVAHEVRNPLNSIRLLLTLLAEDVAAGRTDATDETLRTLDYELTKLTRFTEEFLTWSRPASTVREPIDPADLVRSVVALSQPEASERGVKLSESVAPNLAPLAGDRQRLEQALLNLVLNAIQASGQDGQVTVRVEASSEAIDVLVVDSGPGVPTDVRQRLFEPFFTTRSDGTGLGLANAQRIAKDHGGRIELRDRAPGACFVLHLPLDVA